MLKNQKYVVLFAAIVYNLSIGVLYSWSILKSSLISIQGWTNSQATLPYTVAIVCFALSLFFGGMLQDKYGPRVVVTIGGFFAGFGMIVSSFIISNPTVVMVTFGVISGCGIGLGYSAVTPACLKWFDPKKKGLISGIVVGACGLSALIFSPLTQMLIDSYSISITFMYVGLGILVVSVASARFIVNPDKYCNVLNDKTVSVRWIEMIKTCEFYIIFIIYAFGASVGLMIIGSLKDIYTSQVTTIVILSATVLVALISIFNAFGRIVAGLISDKIGRTTTLTITAIIQVFAMVFFPNIDSEIKIVFGTMLVGYSYGSYLSVIPAFCADRYGLRWYGKNYGIIYLAWGIAGIIAPMSAASFGIQKAYQISAWLSICVLFLCLLLKRVSKVK